MEFEFVSVNQVTDPMDSVPNYNSEGSAAAADVALLELELLGSTVQILIGRCWVVIDGITRLMQLRRWGERHSHYIRCRQTRPIILRRC